MKFKGHGTIWNPKRGLAVVSFNQVDVYETNDVYEIEVLRKSNQVEIIDETIQETPKPEKPKRKRRTKKDK